MSFDECATISYVFRLTDRQQLTCFHCASTTGLRCQERVLFDTPCRVSQCEGNGTCLGMSEEQFYCSCSPGRGGERCEIGELKLNAILRWISRIILTHFHISISFHTSIVLCRPLTKSN